MKGCILGDNLERQRWSSRLFTILLILIWEFGYPQRRGVNRKRGGSFVSCSAWEFCKLFCLVVVHNWGRKDLPGDPGVGGNYTDQL